MGSVLFYLIIIVAAVGTVAMIVAVRQINRYFMAVAQATCVSCGVAFGRATEKGAEKDFEEAFKKVLYEHPGWLLKPAREWPFECPGCGTPHKYHLDERKISAA